MGIVRRLLLLVLSLTLTVSLVALQFSIHIKANLLDPGFYLRALEAQGVFDTVPAIMAGVAGEGLPGLPPAEKSKVTQAVRESIPPEWVKGEVGAILATVADYLQGRSQELRHVISLRERKTDLARTLSRHLSPLAWRELGKELEMGLPDEIDLARLAGPQLREALAGPREAVRLLILAPGAGAALTVALLILVLVAAGRLASAARWLGSSALLAGLLTLAAAFLLAFFASQRTTQLVVIPLPGAQQLPVHKVLEGLAGAFTRPLKLMGGITAGAGLALLALARFFQPRAGPPKPAS